MSRRLFVRGGLLAIFWAASAVAQSQYDPPATYYDGAKSGGNWLTGTALKNALTTIISSNWHQRSYDDVRYADQLLDLDPNNSNNIILIYNGASVPKAWDAGVTWNREHQWPDSRGLVNGSSYSDLFNLKPCNQSINSSRGNDPYGIGSGYWDPDSRQLYGGHDRGDCARSLFYMSTRWTYLVLVNGMPSGSQMGDLAKLLEWHYTDPVGTFERRRNHLVYSSVDNPTYYQGNRNPYIDHPEFVWAIWGTAPNSAKLYVGSTAPGDGASTASVDLGVVIVGGTPTAQTVTLNKMGSTPTTYDINVGGSAQSSAAGKGQAFTTNTQTRTIDVSVPASATTTTGTKTGTITIDDTDLTTAGAGQGAADGNDVISVTCSVVAHSNASFDSLIDRNAVTIDFGSFYRGSGAQTQTFTVYNIPPVTAPQPTAGLDLDSITGSGNTAVLTTDAAPFTDLPVGSSQTFTASFDTSATGTYEAVYTLNVSDQDLSGATSGTPLVLTLRGTVAAGMLGDFNSDEDVDQEDFGHLQDCLNAGGAILSGCDDADLDGSGHIDPADADIFISHMTGPN